MRLFKITKTLLEYLVFNKLNRHSNKILGKRLREACEKLGTTYIKFGQMLSIKSEIFSKEDCKELRKLFEQIQEIPYSKIKEIFQHDFGKYPEEIYEKFNPKPISSASISQVYKAKLKNGKDVAVKVRRPHIGKTIESDMKTLKKLTRFFQFFSPTLKRLSVVTVIDELKSWLLQEIDFKQEVKNMIAIKKYYSFGDLKKFYKNLGYSFFIKPCDKYCSNNIITMDYVKGILLNNVNSIKNNSGYDIKKSIKTYICGGIHAMFYNKGDYLFQADPHLANIFILKDGNCANVDWGFMGKVKPNELKHMKNLFLSVYSQNLNRTIKSSLVMCDSYTKKNTNRIQKDVKIYLEKAQSEGIGFWFMGMVKIFIKHKIPVPSFLASFGRCGFILDGTYKTIAPNSTTLDLIEPILKGAMQKEIINNFKNIKYGPLLYNISEKIKDSPEKFNKLLDQYYDNPLKLIRDVKKTIV